MGTSDCTLTFPLNQQAALLFQNSGRDQEVIRCLGAEERLISCCCEGQEGWQQSSASSMWWKKSKSPTTQARRYAEVVRRRLGKGDVNEVHGINMELKQHWSDRLDSLRIGAPAVSLRDRGLRLRSLRPSAANCDIHPRRRSR